MLLGLRLGAMCNAWMKHAMTSSWVIAPAPVACMTWLSGKVNPSVQVGIVHVRTHILSLTQGHTTTNQLCWFCDTKWNFNRLHTRPHSCSQPTEQQTDPHESQNLSLWPRNSISLPSSHCRLPRKLRFTLTLMVSWNHSSLTWMRGGNKNTSESCKQWHQSEPKHCQKLLKTKHQVPGLDVPRLTGASSSSRVQFPSCRAQTWSTVSKGQVRAVDGGRK